MVSTLRAGDCSEPSTVLYWTSPTVRPTEEIGVYREGAHFGQRDCILVAGVLSYGSSKHTLTKPKYIVDDFRKCEENGA